MLFEERLIFEPTPELPSSHAATITALPDGDLLCAWYSGSREGAPDVAIYGARLSAGRRKWSEPKVLADTPGKPEGNPVLFTDPKSRVWLFHVTMQGKGWHTCDIKFKVSTDGGRTWGPTVPLRKQPGWMVRTKPIVLDNGDYLLPAYDESVWQPVFFISQDEGETWEPVEGPRLPCEAIQPAVVQLSDKSLLAYMRTTCGKVWAARSFDRGRSWTDAGPAPFPNPNSAVELIRLKSGSLLFVFNDSDSKRTPLAVALSPDEGRSWPFKKALETGEGEFSYPAAVQAPDGSIHVVYTWRRLSIKHVTFDEEWVSESRLSQAKEGV